MTVGQALERAEELRPGCKVDSCTRQRWLCEEDGMLRALLFSGCGLRAGVGADLAWPAEGGLDDAVELLVPVPFDALYPHYLCAKLDAALGETERYAGEQARYNSILAELCAVAVVKGRKVDASDKSDRCEEYPGSAAGLWRPERDLRLHRG